MSSDIAQILQRSESETLDFKSARASFDALARVVCGMLNQQGGVIVWGADDHRHVVGINDADISARRLNDFLMRRLSPRPLLSVSVAETEGERVVVIDVPPGSDKPYSFDREILVRLGGKTLRAGEEESANIVKEMARRQERWEREPMPGLGIDDCDSDEMTRARTEIARVGRFGVDVPETDEDLLRRLYVSRNGQLTNAAVVLFAREPEVWAPNLALRVVSSAGKEEMRSIENDVIVEGPAIQVLKEVIATVQRRTGFSGRFVGERLEREDRPAYAPFALREAIVNAMVHRDYASVGGRVQVDILKDRLLIRNPGRLPEGWTTGDLAKKHESHPPNPDIARVFYVRGLMEQLGTGTQRLIEACKELKAKSPAWKSDRGMVELTLFPAPEPDETMLPAGRLARFLQHTKVGIEFKVTDYAERVKVSERQARRDLAELENIGAVERQGKGPSTSYTRRPRFRGSAIRPKSGQIRPR